MASSSSVGDNQLQRIIRDLHDAVLELSKEHNDCGEPVTDDSANLHKFFYKLEYLLQFDQKEKTTFLGQRKDYWDYFCDCLIKIKGANDGIRFVKSIPELKTSLGKGRAFIRYSLVHQRLADTLQQCLINQKITSDWYYARSPFLKSHLTADIINHLYELNQIQFDVAARGYDLDADWPTFARRTLGTASSAFLWRPPSRCSSINSLISSYSQVQEYLPIHDLNPSLLGELDELGEPSSCSIADNLRIELDQSELRQQELLVQVQELGKQADDLKGVVKDLQGQLLATQKTAGPSVSTEAQGNQHTDNQGEANHLQICREAINGDLQNRLTAAENKNMELLTKLDESLKEKGQQTASYCDSAWKIQELLDKLKAAEEERLEAKREAEDRVRHSERLSHDLKLREEEMRISEEKLAEVKSGAHCEREEALERLEELQTAVGRIQGALCLKEKETGNLRAQLQDLQSSLEWRERKAEDLRKRLNEEREEVEQRCSRSYSQNDRLETQLLDVRKTLKNREKELAVSSERIKHLEEQLEKLNVEKASLSSRLADNETVSSEKLQEYKTQCHNLMEINAKVLQTVKKSEGSITELTENRVALLDQLACLRASEKHLKARVEAANLCVEDREKKLLDENLHWEEIAQKVLVQKDISDAQIKNLEHDNQELLELQSSLKKKLATTQQDLDSLTAKAAKLDKNLNVSQRSQGELLEKLKDTEAKLRERTDECGHLQVRAEELESRSGELHHEKGAAESNEKMQRLHERHQTSSTENKDAPYRLVMAEAQLELNLREVQRLQEEVVKLRAQHLAGTEEKMKVQALQEVTESSREDLRILAEQLKAQVEELNRRHVDEILRSREREEALVRERDGEAQARAGLAAEVTASREELNKLKLQYEALCLENSESKEALHRANTETAELGIHVCMLTAENEEARLRWEGLSMKLQELDEEASQEAERLNTCMEQLSQENQRLLDQLHNEKGPSAIKQEELSKAQQEAEAVQATSQEEIQALRFQLSSQTMSHDGRIQNVKQELQEVKSQMTTEQEKVVDLENKYKQLEAENQRYCQQIEEKNTQMADSVNLIRQKEDEIIHLKENLSSSQDSLAAAQRTCQEMSESLRRATQDKQSFDLKTAAELDDLYRTKINLEERLVELIREKDVLWQKSDALEFEQKMRDEETERDVNFCLGCHTQFSWWLRKHTCRLCGRPFCYYCCSNTVSTQQGGHKERCCIDCYNNHTAVVERHPQEEVTHSTPGTPFHRLLQAGRAVTGASGENEGEKADDGVFDIITEEEVSGVYDSDTLSFATACSPEHGQQGAAQLNSSASAGDLTSEDNDDLNASVQDAEICLLKSGDLTLSIPFTVDDISGFGESSRELFIKSSCYSTIPITMSGPGPTVCWTFTSEPKSISFSVVYRESTETTLEQAKVLIPLTRCSSHKETIQGELKVRNAGEYTLIFDNSFSRFISKKVLYQLSLDKPVVYDGTDLL